MKETPIKKEIVDGLIAKMGIQDFAKATIREVKQVAAMAEKESGVEFIKMEMGIPGLPAAQVGVDAQIKALQDGIAHSYPDIQGYPELKKQASRFVKAFIGVDIAPEGCVPVTGSMQGTFASFLTCSQADKKKDTVLFIDPGFPVQKMQLQVQGVKYETFDVYDFRGDKLRAKLESYLRNGNICAIVYSNPNNPSWVCLTEQELQIIGELATRYDTIIMEDLAYFAMDFRQDLSVPFEPPYQPTVARYTDNYMLLISGSKAFSYAGERIGVVCISDKLFHRHYDDLAARYEGLPFGLVFSTRMLYALSSGTSHSAQYAMAAMEKAGIQSVINLDDSVDTMKNYSTYPGSFYSKCAVINPEMNYDFAGKEFGEKVRQSVLFITENDGPYLIHCKEGKDRTGILCAILEYYAGAAVDDVNRDYMTTYYNYYKVQPEDAAYSIILNNNFVKTLSNLFEVDDLEEADLQEEAEQYLRAIGLTSEQLTALGQKLKSE